MSVDLCCGTHIDCYGGSSKSTDGNELISNILKMTPNNRNFSLVGEDPEAFQTTLDLLEGIIGDGANEGSFGSSTTYHL